jgi:hypothetical protein
MNAEDECDRGRALVTSAASWRTEMAKWIGEARAAQDAEDSDGGESGPSVSGNPTRARNQRWTPMKLSQLFGGEVKPPKTRMQVRIDEEAELMEALAEQEEDERPDDGEIEDSGDEYP